MLGLAICKRVASMIWELGISSMIVLVWTATSKVELLAWHTWTRCAMARLTIEAIILV
jgi:hypothetical protein